MGEPSLSPRALFWRRFRRDRWAMAGLTIVGVLVVMAVLAPTAAMRMTGHGPNDVFPNSALNEFGLPLGPSADFPLGADTAGRDVLIRILYGARTSLTIAVIATAISIGLGLLAGLAAGYFGGRIDLAVSRLVDLVLALPVLLIALGLASACGGATSGCLGGAIRPGLFLVGLIIALFTWPYTARLVRGEVLAAREAGYVEASHSIGSGNVRIMTRQILPNIAEPLIVYATFLVPANILLEATLSYLGVGLPPTTPSWGRMLAEAGGVFTSAWWLVVAPGGCLLLATLAFNIVGDGLRDALDARVVR